jgi:LmbE family N-acetylglucosaminyl deacetylase
VSFAASVAALVAPAIRPVVPVAIRLGGREVTRAAAGRSCLVLAPHADDETLGCGATIARKRSTGTAVHVLVATDGRHGTPSAVISPEQLAEIRRAEVLRACAVLGVDETEVTVLDHEDGRLDRAESELADLIAEHLERTAPDEVLVTAPADPHPDHAALGRAAIRAVAGSRTQVLTYPVWQWPLLAPWFSAAAGPSGPIPPAWRSRPDLVRIGEFEEVKRAALAEHRSQVTNLTGEPGWHLLEDSFLRHFFRRHEVFFRVRSARDGERSAAQH